MGELIPFRRSERQAVRRAAGAAGRPASSGVERSQLESQGVRRAARPEQPASVAPEQLWRVLVGDRLRNERRRRGETLAEVSGRAGISIQYLSELERGRKEPSSEVLAAVAGALQVTLLDLTVAVARELHAQRIAAGRPTGPVALAA